MFGKKEKTKPINLELPLSLHKKIKSYSADKGTYMKEEIILAIRKHVGEKI